jgi:hypothetical protein
VRVPVLSKKLKAKQHQHPLITVVTALAGWALVGRQRGKKNGKPNESMQQALMTGGAFAARFALSHLMQNRKGRRGGVASALTDVAQVAGITDAGPRRGRRRRVRKARKAAARASRRQARRFRLLRRRR